MWLEFLIMLGTIPVVVFIYILNDFIDFFFLDFFPLKQVIVCVTCHNALIYGPRVRKLTRKKYHLFQGKKI